MARTSAARTKKTAAPGKAVRKKAAAARPKKAAKKAVSRTISARPRSAGKLSKSTMRARWIESTGDHEDRPGQSLATRSHAVILKWAEERGAKPATVPSTSHGDRPGVLRFDFPGFNGGKQLQQISWDEWFKSFDERKLVFLYQEHLKNGNQSNFFRLANPEREEALLPAFGSPFKRSQTTQALSKSKELHKI